MEKFDLRELNKMVLQFRRCHRAILRLRDEENEFEVSFTSPWSRRSGGAVPLVDEAKVRAFLIAQLEAEVTRLRKRFAEMGIDPIDADARKKKKADLKVAK